MKESYLRFLSRAQIQNAAKGPHASTCFPATYFSTFLHPTRKGMRNGGESGRKAQYAEAKRTSVLRFDKSMTAQRATQYGGTSASSNSISKGCALWRPVEQTIYTQFTHYTLVEPPELKTYQKRFPNCSVRILWQYWNTQQ